MDQNICSEIWDNYVQNAETTGLDEKNGKQAAYSLYTAFYEENSCYDNLENDLIKAFFRENNFTVDFAKSKEELGNKLMQEFGGEAERIMNSISPEDLNDEQREAILNALVQPITKVQGPPGTGKTEMILYFLSVITQLDLIKRKNAPEAVSHSVAIVSCNGEAIKNITEKLKEYKDKNEIFNEVFERCAILGRQSNREKWSGEDNNYNDYVCKDNEHGGKFKGKYVFREKMLEKYPIFTSTIHSLPKIFEKKMNFDYVIVDECSQVSISLGLIAMAHAKHLIVVGDDFQLQAIIPPESVKCDNELYEKLFGQTEQTEEENKSFLKACQDIFPDSPQIMLKNHYRCHPSIAEFCNKYVYSNQLNVKKKAEKNDLRISITYYDGEFMERQKGRTLTENNRKEYEETGRPLPKPHKNDKTPSQRCNFRQIRIFLEEMLPSLKDKIKSAKRDEKLPSICVLAPYCVQLEVLKDELSKDEDFKDLLMEIDGDPNSDSDEKKLKPDSQNDLQSLSIHKAQGRGYDIVYLMTVEDVLSNKSKPWGQNMRIINVAVSRAKEELHVITSSIWIPQYIRKNLPEFENVNLPLPQSIGRTFADDREEESFYSAQSVDEKTKEHFYIGRLCKWVYDNWCGQGQKNFGEFGFHKAKADSVFDCFFDSERSVLKDAIANELEFDVKTGALNDVNSLGQMLIREAENDDEKQESSLTDFEKFLKCEDFLFVCKENSVKAIVHILDKQYRDACSEKFGFQSKLEKYIRELNAGKIYVQIPTNGSQSNEIELVRRAVSRCAENNIRLNYEQNSFSGMLNDFTKSCLDKVNSFIDKGIDKEKLNALDLDYRASLNVEYTVDRQNFYFCRYGTAYAFEYALIYDLVFRSMTAKEINILSLGCGSCVDAFSAAYSRDFCGKNEIPMTYHGVDCVKWELDMLSHVKDKYFKTADIEIIPLDGNDSGGIVKFFEDLDVLRFNVVLFPKILNELNEKTRKKLIAAVTAKLDTNIDEYYFCFSLSKETSKKDACFVEALAGALDSNNDFDFEDCIEYILDEDQLKTHKEKWGNIGFHRPNDDCYSIESSSDKICSLNPDFCDVEADDGTEAVINKLNDYNRKNCNWNIDKDRFRSRIITVNPIAYFQIIKLTKKE